MKLNRKILKTWIVGLSTVGFGGLSVPSNAEVHVANRDIYLGDNGEPVVMANREKYSFEKSKGGTQIWSVAKDYALEVDKNADRLTRITEGFAVDGDESKKSFSTQTTSVAGGLIKSRTRCSKEQVIVPGKGPAKTKKAASVKTEISCMTITPEYCEHLNAAFESVDTAAAAQCFNILAVLTEAYDNLAQDKEAAGRLKRLGKSDQAAIEKLYAKRIEGKPTHFKTIPLEVSADAMSTAGGSMAVIATLKVMCDELQRPEGDDESSGTTGPAPQVPGATPAKGKTAI